MKHEKLEMGRRLSRFVETTGATPGVALTPAVVVTMGGPPPSSSLTREALIRRIDGASSGGYGG
jgi:hypothetical protein